MASMGTREMHRVTSHRFRNSGLTCTSSLVPAATMRKPANLPVPSWLVSLQIQKLGGGGGGGLTETAYNPTLAVARLAPGRRLVARGAPSPYSPNHRVSSQITVIGGGGGGTNSSSSAAIKSHTVTPCSRSTTQKPPHSVTLILRTAGAVANVSATYESWKE